MSLFLISCHNWYNLKCARCFYTAEEKDLRLAMNSYRRCAWLWLACLPMLLVLNACDTVSGSNTATPVSPTTSPNESLWTNNFPPIQDNGATLRFLHFGSEEGLSQSSAQVVLQDNLGFLWIGTQDGLNRFDGYSFKVFQPNPNDADALSSGEILSMFKGANGTLWIGTDTGLNRFDPISGKFKHWVHDGQNPTSLANNVVQAIYQDPQGALWIGTQGGLDQFDLATNQFLHIRMPDKTASSSNADSINALYEDGHHTLWIGTNQGLIRFSIADQKFQRYQNENGNDNSLSFDEVTSIREDQDGMLWIGTHRGLNRLDPSSGEIKRFLHSELDPRSLVDDFVQITYVDRAGEIWVGTRKGLDRFDPVNQSFTHYQNDPMDPASLSSNVVYSIFEDRGGVLWIGTDAGGLNEHDRSQDQFAYYHHVNSDPASLGGDVIFPILPSPSGKIWIGTYQAGLDLFDPATGRAEHFRHDPVNPSSLIDDTVLSLFLDKDGTLWIGTQHGMDKLLPGSSQFFHYFNSAADPNTIPFGTVFVIYQDNQSTYWVGTAHGLRIFNPFNGKFIKPDASGANLTGLTDGPVEAIFQDKSGILWFGTYTHGLFRMNPATKRLEQYTNDPKNKNSLSSNSVLDIYEDSRGLIWIATFGGGLDRYLPDKNGFIQFQQEQGLPNDVVYGVLEDQNGDLWMSTNLGISRFNISTGVFENFTVKDGLQSNEFDSSSFAKDSTGRMYFGGVKGLTVFNPADIHRNPYIPPLVITSLTTQDSKPVATAQTVETLQSVALAYPQNSFDLSFLALSYAQIEMNQYKYMLEGFDQNWHNAGPFHQASYTNLPGGTYTLHVIGSNSDGVWNEVGAAVKVTVIPPFWQTWIFRGFTGMAVILAAFLAYRSRVRGMQAQQAELEHLVLDRTQALKKQNLDLEALYAADEKMLRVLTQDEVLRALVDVAVDILQADKSAVFTQAADSCEYSVQVSRGFHPKTVQSPLFAKSQQAILVEVAAGEPFVVSDTAADPSWEQQRGEIIETMSAEGIRSLMYMRIKVQDSVLGVFSIYSSVPGAFNDERQRLFTSLVQRAALSIENSRLFVRTKHMAILEERNRLAQELHDNAKQKAFAALAQLGAAKKLVNQNHANAAEHLIEAENIVSEVIHDLTFFIQESYPSSLKDKGLASSLRNYAFSWESRFGIQLNLTILGEHRLPLDIEQTLYRVVQEALSNVARHSQATQAKIQIAYQEHEIQIQIEDNGSGFEVSKTVNGLGLRLIRERLESIGGQVDIQSRLGKGTTITLIVPV
jgi:ligand-binding sensor domain-containing protein/signal transduction histidine kinase